MCAAAALPAWHAKSALLCALCCSWYRPGPPFVSTNVVDYVRKKLGFVPLLMWGRFGTFVPNKVMSCIAFRPVQRS